MQSCLGCKHGRQTGCFCHVSNLEGLHFAENVVLMEGHFTTTFWAKSFDFLTLTLLDAVRKTVFLADRLMCI